MSKPRSARVPLSLFSGAEVELIAPVTDTDAQAALAAFLALPPAALMTESRHVFAYYLDTRADCASAVDTAMPVVNEALDIWDHVHPSHLAVEPGYDGDPHFHVSLEANCTWEPEHGLELVWKGGLELIKAGPCNGRLTHAHAYDDPRLAGIVYLARNAELTTRLTA